jgi:hypothetical protein
VIVVRHTACEWVASLLDWERLPTDASIEPVDGVHVAMKTCPRCRGSITCASLEYAGDVTTDAALTHAVPL